MGRAQTSLFSTWSTVAADPAAIAAGTAAGRAYPAATGNSLMDVLSVAVGEAHFTERDGEFTAFATTWVGACNVFFQGFLAAPVAGETVFGIVDATSLDTNTQARVYRSPAECSLVGCRARSGAFSSCSCISLTGSDSGSRSGGILVFVVDPSNSIHLLPSHCYNMFFNIFIITIHLHVSDPGFTDGGQAVGVETDAMTARSLETEKVKTVYANSVIEAVFIVELWGRASNAA